MKPEMIILHHSLTKDSETMSWNAIRRYHTGVLGWSAIGYHSGIELINDSYEILQGRMLNEQGAHTYGHNHNSLGLCFIGNYDKDEVPPEMWNLGIKLVASWCDIFKIDPIDVFGHHDFNKHKSCPGEKFNVSGFRVQLRETLNL